MLQSYLFPISYAFLTFPIAALFFTLPFLIVQYRKYGYVNKFRAFILYLMLLYLMNVYYLVMLPLPASRHNMPLHGGALQLLPFNFIQDIMRETSVIPSQPSTYLHLIKERAFLQVVFNMMLTVPFGMFLRYYFRTGWLRCIILSFALSLSFEVTQLTGIYGIYDHPYRVFDVDDLMSNTLGGIIGFLLAEWFSGLLPRVESLDHDVDVAAKRVSYTRRGVAFLFDFAGWMIVLVFCLITKVPLAFWVSSGVYFMLIPYLTQGRTLGKWLVRIQLVGEDEDKRIPLSALFIRYGLLYWLVFGLNRLLLDAMQVLPIIGKIPFGLGVLIMDIWFFLYLVRQIFKKEPLLFYEKISKTRHRIFWRQSPASTQELKQGQE
ncbi:teicoplanin resistance protein VanZ [Paenibacillus sp. CAA11]|uniref:VanZ family protein n=1 Tax=Paenibacillus sp. CAA11 TaxID=1532905 RepID=UPI000D35F719|nr:VanZ family protein [Paenibacillus sp. CAA11]AWB43731.1 teicoplanin resistance protein VanZ [Paenibacillus sp. CAA11]